MIRQVKIAKDTAVKARSQAIVTLQTVIVTAPVELREQLERLGDTQLIEYCRQLRFESMSGPADAAYYVLRALAERYHALDQEAHLRDRVLATLTDRAAPVLTSLFGVGTDSAAALLLVVGDNPERIRSEAALAKLCGACPVPVSSGKPPGTASTAAATGRPTPPCTASCSPGRDSTNPPSITSTGAPPRGRPRKRSFAAWKDS